MSRRDRPEQASSDRPGNQPESSSELPKIVHDDLQVSRDPDRGRFELRQHEQFIGFVGYTEDPVTDAHGEERCVARLQHTIIDEKYGRRGYARALVTIVLERLGAEGFLITPECSYVEDYLRRYPEYRPMVYHGPVVG